MRYMLVRPYDIDVSKYYEQLKEFDIEQYTEEHKDPKWALDEELTITVTIINLKTLDELHHFINQIGHDIIISHLDERDWIWEYLEMDYDLHFEFPNKQIKIYDDNIA